MTSIHQALRQQLESLKQVLTQLDTRAYCYTSHWLSNATIGQHTRHVIELVQCMVTGYENGLINYDSRKRDQLIETDPLHAISAIENIFPSLYRPDKEIVLKGCFDNSTDENTMVTSTYNREIVYNIEHAVHHMALIKVVLKELEVQIVNEEFGVAYATVQYRRVCAQ